MQQVQQGGGRYGGCGGRARARIEKRQFTENFAGSEDCKQGFAAVIRGVAQLHFAFGHDVQTVTEIAFFEEGFAASQCCLTHLLLQRCLLRLIESTEERDLVDEVCISIHKAGTPFYSRAPLACAADY